MADVIPSLDSVTPEWLTSRLRQNDMLEEGSILDVKFHPNPAFNSVAAHLKPVYSANAPAGVPERLFIKIKQHHWGRDEVSFYRLANEQKPPLPMLIPFIDGAYDEDTGISHCLMLDVSGTHHAPVSRARLLAGDGVPEEGELAVVWKLWPACTLTGGDTRTLGTGYPWRMAPLGSRPRSGMKNATWPRCGIRPRNGGDSAHRQLTNCHANWSGCTTVA